MSGDVWAGTFGRERAATMEECHVEYVVGLSSENAQLIFVGAPDALFGNCSFVLKDAAHLDYFMHIFAGEQCLARMDAVEGDLATRDMMGEDVPETERPSPQLTDEEMDEVRKVVFPFIESVLMELKCDENLSKADICIDRAIPLWTRTQPPPRRAAQGFAVEFEDKALMARIFEVLRLVEMTSSAAAVRPKESATSSTEHVSWHGRCGMANWSLPKCVAETSEAARPGYQTNDGSEYVDDEKTLRSKVRVLADMLRRSKGVVVYTGAGVSTAAGIGDYASKAPGSHAPHMQSSGTSQSRLDLKPTFAHHALAAMEETGLVHHWLQQNHDRLAQKAGFPQERINEIHGAWGDDKNMVKMMDDTLRDDLLKWMAEWTERADLCVAIGTSLCGMNADHVAQACAERHLDGGQMQQGLVIINLQRTAMDCDSSLRIWSVIDDVFRLLASELKLRVPSKSAAARGEQWVARHPRCKYNTPKRSVRDPL
eukprot:TRINITY_DN22829_c0_g1_i1.p1 TRINITY_DN22829_c0_g1~~TRINITY_DN22829_c0_g1_i1.p1  ORF type:complete len:496 (-),score=93.08 TRINITY_DN22829_c0_g1_i1:137-1588(-)